VLPAVAYTAPMTNSETPAGDAAAGLFVVFEGIDGAGKSEQTRRLAARLRGLGADVVETFEPTDGPYGRRFRAWARGDLEASPEEVLELFLDDRDDHVRQSLAPALARGSVVLCDRYVASTLAYQRATGIPAAQLGERLRAHPVPVPDLTLWLRLPVDRALERLDRERERFERADFLRRVDAEYATLGMTPIDASRSVDAVEESIWLAVEPLWCTRPGCRTSVRAY